MNYGPLVLCVVGGQDAPPAFGRTSETTMNLLTVLPVSKETPSRISKTISPFGVRSRGMLPPARLIACALVYCLFVTYSVTHPLWWSSSIVLCDSIFIVPRSLPPFGCPDDRPLGLRLVRPV